MREGLNFILEETCEDIDAVFPEEREFLFSTLSRLEKVDIHEQYSSDSELFEKKILLLPISGYHFITHIFSDTIVVDKIAAIHYLSVVLKYPLKQEVKGITHDLVKDVIKAAAQGAPPVFETAPAPEESAAEVPPKEQGNIIRIPAALWEGRPPSAVCDAMKSEYSDAVIAYVLYWWRKVPKTTIGNVLLKGTLPPDKMPTDDKSYRNLANKLLKEADSLTIVKA